MSSVRTTDVVVIGGGQAGLAMSRHLTDRSIDHVVLERGDVANSWTTERWDSLRLLTPNWMSRLPGFHYDGDDPDGFMTAAEVADHLHRYRRTFDAPVSTNVTVDAVRQVGDRLGYRVDTDAATWSARAVVVATGACGTPDIPAIADHLPGRIQQLTPIDYRNPGQLDDGGVLVVGASASGLQIADELVCSGRSVTLATGDHVRVPRTYRGMDIQWWLDTIGVLDERYDEVDDIRRARRTPSLQLVGSHDRRELDLNSVTDRGVRLAGRLVGVDATRLQFSGSLANVCTSADLKLHRLLDRIDEYADQHGLVDEIGPASRPEATRVGDHLLAADLSSVSSVVWATGFRPDYPWLDQSLLDRKGAIVHDGGVMRRPGMYVLGLTFLRRRKSSFIDGVGIDAGELAASLQEHLDRVAAGATA